MKRIDKIGLLTAIQRGELPLSAVVPEVKASFIETMSGNFIDMNRFYMVSFKGLDNYMQVLKEAHPKSRVTISIMY